jgi:hypothetical protein
MKHASSRDLFAYWNERRGQRLAPERGEIEPAAIRHMLGDAFILAYDGAAGYPVRLAGTRVCALFCRELKNEAFANLWAPASMAAIRDALRTVAHEATGLVAGVTGRTERGATVDLELLLLPLSYRRAHQARMIGVLAPATAPYWLGEYPLAGLVLGSHRLITPELDGEGAPRLRAAPPNGRLNRGFFVYEGGRSEQPQSAFTPAGRQD